MDEIYESYPENIVKVPILLPDSKDNIDYIDLEGIPDLDKNNIVDDADN